MQERRTAQGDEVLVPETVIRSVATNLYRARVNALPKMSQERLSEESDISINTIAKIEGLRDPSVVIVEGFQFGTILRLAEALALSTNRLFSPTPPYGRGKSAGRPELALILNPDEPIRTPPGLLELPGFALQDKEVQDSERRARHRAQQPGRGK